jgi:ketosteroid isomerase-like protein
MFEPKRAATEAAVLQANAMFYRAFTRGDHAAMSELWARRAPVACFHPASPVLVGREAVLESWSQILRAPTPAPMRCDHALVHLAGEAAAVVTCYEGNGERPAHLAATNVFVLEDGAWRMAHHHAGPLSSPIPKPADPASVN